MDILFRLFKERGEVAMFIRQRDVHKLTGLRGRWARRAMESDGWRLGVYTLPGSPKRFKAYRRFLNLAVKP